MEIKLKLSELLTFLKRHGHLHPDFLLDQTDECSITGFSSIYETKPGTLSWMTAQALDWETIHSSVIICSQHAEVPSTSNHVFLPVENPRNTFALVLREFSPQPSVTGISPTAIIGQHCVMGKHVYVGHHVVIGDHVTIGDYTQIHHNVTIQDNVTIGSHCIIHSGAIIGADGFGYEQDANGYSFKIPHIGEVILEDHVEIGCNTCVARGVLAKTIISRNTKIGNLNHISHNVSIGKNTMITHLAHIGGSVQLEDDCWVGPGALYIQGVTVGKNSLTGMGAVVIRDVQASDVVAGVPAKPIRKRD